ncbi:GNAT family N-acetyltransferase [Pseudonocardia alaniniphila]|uniref:GNAT family N-acetyltransferase n=1 Tax=Pseudonocardia alaniniphila TaxID=75291 RepID=A0ABS9TR51_9PSEU|nr:GNAT family N-acetyltransferase [Pseudonocardia alaniniphila]MCH6171027.1 GNAT family N-acetyltransferase [Pseudonocardia alaniniphila]
MSTAFFDDPVCRWFFPDEAQRETQHPPFFWPLVEVAYAHGEVYLTDDRTGAALWLPVDVSACRTRTPDIARMFEGSVGRSSAARIGALGARSAEIHPMSINHDYLPLIAVRPEWQGTGHGAALLDHRHAALDQRGRAAYLTASNQRSAKFYERFGYRRLAVTIDVPGGPSLYPMWRNPVSPDLEARVHDASGGSGSGSGTARRC